MGEHDKHEKPRVYESIAPETRFIAMASSILENIGQMPPESGGNVKIARWPNDQRGDHYKLHASAGMGMWGDPRILITVDHFAPELPANVPKNRYQVQSGVEGISPISITDGKNVPKQLDKRAKREAISFILGALAEAAPEEGARYLQEAFAYRFSSLAADYVLSDLALQSPAAEIDENLRTALYADYQKHVNDIKVDELKQAKKRRKNLVDPNLHFSRKAYYESVEEAVFESRQGPTNINKYSDVDVQLAMKRAVKEMNGKWRHTITTETGTYTALPDSSPET